MKTPTNSPQISVIMPVYNAEKFLHAAINSVLDQTFTNFELIMINDGSTDRSREILDEYSASDSRIIVHHRENRGLVATLNESIELSRGKYIARIDSDDVCFLNRFAIQVEVLRSHPEIVLVTGCFEVFDEDDEYLYREVVPQRDEDIKRAMYLRNPIGHSSVMFRKETYLQVGGYSNSYGPTEDYELWCRLADQGSFYSLEEAVFKWRVNTLGITSTKSDEQKRIMKQHIGRLWKTKAPQVLRRKDLKKAADYYYKTYSKRGVSMKEIILSDNSQLGVKMIKHGRFIDGIHQLLVVASIGRSGLKAVIQRVFHIYKGGSTALYRHLKKRID